MAINERAQAQIYLDGKQAEAALQGLSVQAKKLKEAIIEAGKAGDQASMKKLQSELKGVQSAQRSLKKETFDVQKVLDNLNGSSFNDLQKALRKTTTEMKRMDRTDPGYSKKANQAKMLKTEMSKINGEMQAQQSLTSKVSNGFNKYFGIITAGAASLTGLIMVGRKAIDAFNEFDDQVADVMKTTGMTKDEVLELNKRLQTINTRTAQDELLGLARVAGKLGITGVENVEGFVRASDKINVALSEDLGGNAEDAINAIGKLTDIFKLKDEFGIEQAMIKVGSAINSLGAASTANEGYLVEFTKRMAGVAPSAKMSIDQVLGLGATLDQFGQQSEVSSTTVGAVLTDMFKKPAEYAKIAGVSVDDFNKLLNKDSNEAFLQFLEGLNGNSQGLGDMANKLDDLGLSGKRSVSILGVLSSNTKTLREQQQLSAQEFEKGTSLQEEFNIKNETAAAKLEKAQKIMAQYRIELGEKLQPVMAQIISKGSMLMKLISVLIDFASKHGTQIAIVAGAIATYTAAVKIKAKWDQITLAYTKAKMVAEKAYGVISGVVTGKIKLATAAQRIWNITAMKHPLLLIVAAAALLVVGIVSLVKHLNQASAAQRALNEVQKEAEKATASERNEIEQLVRIAKDERFSREEREKAIKRLNEISPEYLGNLSLETINTQEATNSIHDYIKAMEEKALVQAIDDKIAKLMGDNAEKEIEGTKGKIKWYQAFGNAVISSSNIALNAELNRQTIQKNAEKHDREYNETLEALMTKRAEILSTGKAADGSTGLTEAEKIKLAEAEAEKARKEAADEAATQRVENAKKALEQLEKNHQKELVELKRQRIKKGETQEWYNNELLMNEFEYLNKKLNLQKAAGDDTLKTEETILDKQLKLREGFQKNIDNINKHIEKLENEAIDIPEIDTEGFDEDYQKGLDALNRFDELKEKFQTDEEKEAKIFAINLAELDEALEFGIISHEEYEKRKTEITKKGVKSRLEEEQKYLQAAGTVVNTLSNVFEVAKQRELKAAGNNAAKKEAIEIKYAKKQQKISIGQALINGAMAQLKILSEVPKADFGIMTAILMAAAATATAAEIATISAQQFDVGGYTGGTNKYKPAGIVHENEFVANQAAVRNPSVNRFLGLIDFAQRNGTISNLTIPSAVVSSYSAPLPGYDVGGYVRNPGTNTTAQNYTPGTTPPDPQQAAINAGIFSLLNKLSTDGIHATANINAREVTQKSASYESNIQASNY